MQILTALEPLRTALSALKNNSGDARLALVPTMGALHEGHLTLVREAKARAEHVVVSIFVNPRQFGPNEDLATYPRQLEADARLLEAEGVDVLWAPTVEVVYPPAYATSVQVSGLDAVLCGAARPGHFDGVATVVSKLFNQVQPDVALFGEKDWQQLAIIRRMARDLDLTRPRADAILGVPTVREADGLAMSSRNKYLTADERAAAPAMNRAMRVAAERIVAGEPVAQALAVLRAKVLAAGFRSIDYADLRDAATLEDLAAFDGRPARLLVAAHMGKARLIDNVAVG
ncbi:pantoate--beta-alanine ligase [Novosphingobium sp. PASSN1]|uniref:pantoate--beta-alanine ligase n=1 Tax=Novosphingobium sp. PASSN1 TaxID=2015561 RepID=UPI000BD6C26C|nr:pantoate--beta-alanine ligase [Novosphingobium sp. PASSN1]OYU36655.1 MAG: pantoate--beta-alanine ligase [Novosphingobium sp. PASSN1]